MKQQSYFRSSGFLQEEVINTESGESLDLTKLPSFLRTLLVTDGTVTKSLEAWFWENVKIKTVSNHLEIIEKEVSGLEVEIGDKVLQREVMLKGVESDTVYACARSTVSLKHLPQEIGLALEKGEIGIGELLREKGVETYRDIFNINYLIDLPKNDTLISSLQAELLSRSYRIRVNSHPAIIVTEFFPINIYKDN
ncbi:MAG: chorismate pyruvate-lyase family protein [Cocleimonas sp.]